MSTIIRTILLGLLAIFIITGCSSEEVRREVEIIKISGTLPQIMSSTGALFGNDSIKIGEATLILTIEEQNGHIRTLEVLDGRIISKVALLSRICVGSKFTMTFTIVDEEKDLVNDPKYYIGKIVADDILAKEDCPNRD